MKIHRFYVNGHSYEYIRAGLIERIGIRRKIRTGNTGVIETLCLAARLRNAQFVIMPRYRTGQSVIIPRPRLEPFQLKLSRPNA